jgi:hypothetical protein
MIRWWNAGRYERECAAFDAEHPLSRQVWNRLQQFRAEDWLWLATQPIGIKLPEPDQTDEWFRIRYMANMEVSYTGYNGVFHIP